MMPILFLLLAYLFGSIPFGYLAGRARGIDLRQEGSGNLGATNVYRVLGARMALPVIVLDVLKGFLPVSLFPLWDGRAWPLLPELYGLAAIAGHIWPVFLRFRGGKGVATAGGVMLGLAPVAMLVAFLAWTGLALITRIVSLASLVAATLVPLLAFLGEAPLETVIFAIWLAALVWWTHRSNLQRLIRGEELTLRGKGREDDAGDAGE